MPLTRGYVKYGAKPFVYKKIDKIATAKPINIILKSHLLSFSGIFLP